MRTRPRLIAASTMVVLACLPAGPSAAADPSPFTGPPAAAASPSPDRSPSPAAAELSLHVPSSIRSTCAEQPFDADHEQRPGQLALVECHPSAEAVLTYASFATTADEEAEFDLVHEVALLWGLDGPVQDCEQGTFTGTWERDGIEAGRLDCQIVFGTASIVWSSPEARILSVINQADGDAAAAYALWRTAGPVIADTSAAAVPSVAP